MRKNFLDGNYLEKEVTLTIRVPNNFNEDMERRIDETLADALYNEGCELIDSKEYRDVSKKNEISVNRVTLVRERPCENEVWSDNFWVDANKTPSVDLFKAAVEEYLRTPDGKADIEAACNDFNWGDAIIYVPLEVWEAHGIYDADGSYTPKDKGLIPNPGCNGFTFVVDQDEVLIPNDFYNEQEVNKPSLSDQIQSASARSGASRPASSTPTREPDPEL